MLHLAQAFDFQLAESGHPPGLYRLLAHPNPHLRTLVGWLPPHKAAAAAAAAAPSPGAACIHAPPCAQNRQQHERENSRCPSCVTLPLHARLWSHRRERKGQRCCTKRATLRMTHCCEIPDPRDHPLPQVSQRLVAEFATEADVQEIGSVLRSWLGVLTGAPRKACFSDITCGKLPASCACSKDSACGVTT